MAMQQAQVQELPRIVSREVREDLAGDTEGGEEQETGESGTEAEEETGEEEGGDDLESDESGASQTDASKGKRRFTPKLDVDLDKETDPEKLRLAARRAKDEWERAENDRRKEQSFRGQAEADLGKALDALKNNTVRTETRGGEKDDTPDVDTILAELDEGDGYVSGAKVQEVLKKIVTAGQSVSQKRRVREVADRVGEILSAKPDVDDVIAHGREAKLINDQEHPYLSGLGNYYRIKAHKLEASLSDQIKKAREEGKAEGRREAEKRRKQSEGIPTMGAGGRGPSSGPKPSKGGLVDVLLQRRRERGITT